MERTKLETQEKRMRPKALEGTIGALVVLGAIAIGGAISGQVPQATAPFDAQKTYPVDALKADLQVLWDILEEGHGGFDRYTPAARLKKSFDAVGSGLTGPLTESDFYVRLLPLIAEIKDGHTRLSLSPRAGAHLDSRPIHLPFGLRFLGDKAYVLKDLSPDRSVGEGAELLAIEGRPVQEILTALLTLIPSDAGIRTAKLRRIESPGAFGRLLALRFGQRESYRVRFRPHKAGEAREITVPGITAGDISRLQRERYPATSERRPNYELAFNGQTAVLTVRQFGDDPDKARTRFPEFLTDAFRSLEEKKTPGLVIDLRGNGGGLDEYGKFLFAHVMDRPFLYYWALETKKDRYDLFRYTDETAEAAAELAQPLSRNARGRFDVLGHPNRGLQSTRKPHFAGRVALLVDGGSFSATGETTSAFHYYKKAVFFGEECGSGYYGNTSGFMVTATLPASRIRVRVPLVLYTMAVDGYPKDRGIVPDFPVTPTIEDLLAGRDVMMERALAYLEKRDE
jgi:C-terminal processing protease CtpA/Prc